MSISEEAQRDVHRAYLTSQRQRFKTEINRLTSGEMLQMLEEKTSAGEDAARLSFFMSYIFAWHWLQQNINAKYQAEVLSSFCKGPQAFLMEMLLQSDSTAEFVRAYIQYWQQYQGEAQVQQQNLLQLLQHKNAPAKLAAYIESLWDSLQLFDKSFDAGYKELAKQEKDRYADMLADEDKERLALVDQLADTEPLAVFSKLGIIPAMGCPQTCRHCMFIFRPLMKNTDDPAQLYRMIDGLTTSVLFTGGDLTKHLDHFYNAIASMQHVTTFAILLNGDFADSRQVTKDVLGKMAAAIRRRSVTWPRAKVMLQVSFDEFHQEVVVNRQGELNERIPVTKIANIVEVAPKYKDEIQLCLLHKQGHLNFSMELFKKGVFARLVSELGRRGHQVQVLSSAPSSRLKRNPLNPEQPAPLIKDATFVLTKYPDAHLLLTSTTIDAYGRANMMQLHEAVNERDLLKQMLDGNGTGGETFDKDLMFWFNGWATLFSAVHMCLGNVFEDGMETIRKRQLKDPLSNALNRFDLRLLDYYRELRDDLDDIIERSTSPHHLFHTITEDGAMRLHMTRRLIDS
ncbi:MAG: hypothetical protein KJN89_12615 [Gammaproteobacteria bacterium]|nr:hypothetical protein [Gammaproteobacteria bacterium]NNJ51209.1 hypothetical protein [Gammaproteobacteria bacterium]